MLISGCTKCLNLWNLQDKLAVPGISGRFLPAPASNRIKPLCNCIEDNGLQIAFITEVRPGDGPNFAVRLAAKNPARIEDRNAELTFHFL